ncbi:MAG: single-stranded-DNA-specific exonuclease RecJ [Puniceicoccales bacterium]|jgi:single-stranded-DNA-specific exonuclease|nr:single-stranded-DNA-specific exonuclease RecJ [Puniceicoccales bacterium]
MTLWTYHPPPGDIAAILESGLQISPAVAEILAKNGIKTAEEGERHLRPRLAHLADPALISNVQKAAGRIARAIASKEKISILGDYDVDGVTSTTLLVDVLRALGADPSYFVPRRLEEGYGMSAAVVGRVLAEGGHCGLFIALDCGTNSLEETRALSRKGVEVIIIDHHRSKDPPAEGCILVNPHVYDNEGPGAPWRLFCTVGLVFKVCHALLKLLRAQDCQAAGEIVLKNHLDLVAMGTVADLVPLRGENRLLVRHGLDRLRETSREGLRALKKTSGVLDDARLLPTDVSFRLGPRINASGRLADAILPVQMLLESNPATCADIAERLNGMNRERQEIERRVCAEATTQLEAMSDAYPHALCAHGDWHPGVVGIVAGKLCRHFNRPCIVLGSEGAGMAKGSGRGVNGVNLVEALHACMDILDSWGGHPMAVGISILEDRVGEFRQRFDAAVNALLKGEKPCAEPLQIAAWMDRAAITDDFLDQLELLQPFGEGNPEPIFGVADITLRTPPVLFGAKNYRFQIQLDSWRRLGVVAWRQDTPPPPVDTPLDLAVKLAWNYYNGRRYPHAELIQWRQAK